MVQKPKAIQQSLAFHCMLAAEPRPAGVQVIIFSRASMPALILSCRSANRGWGWVGPRHAGPVTHACGFGPLMGDMLWRGRGSSLGIRFEPCHEAKQVTT